MTREEKKNALHCLKVMIDEEVCEECDLYGTTGTDHCEADCVRVAIEALEQEPCEDAISRQAAIDAVKKIHPVDTEYDCTLYDKIDVMYVLKDLPPVNPQPKTGKWLNGDCKGGNCSICGKYYAFYPESGDFNYCPNCGAKMVEPQESEVQE